MDLLGFWSYVHADDEVDMGRVTQLAEDIVGHYQAITAENIQLFLDRDDIHWGDEWRDKVDEALSNVAFFIPVITPRYFKRVECIREFQFFANRANKLGISKLIMPILYIDVPELQEDQPTDPVMQQVKKIQWEPWVPFRFKDRESGDYRTAVDSLARELVRRVALVERVDVAAAAQTAEDELLSDDGEAGTIDRIAALEEAMPRFTATLTAMTAEIERIGNIMEQGAASIKQGDQQGKGFAARLTVARRVADELGGPVDQIETLGQTFASDLAEIDDGVRVLLEEGRRQTVESGDPADQAALCEYVNSLRSLAQASVGGMSSIENMIKASAPLEKMSKDMRSPLRRLRASLTAMLQAREITASWVDYAESLGIECPEPDTAV